MAIRNWMSFLVIAFPLISFAQSDFRFSDDASLNTTTYKQMTPALYEAEGMMTFYGMGTLSSPSIGASLTREIFQDGFIGFRTMLPIQERSRANLYTIELLGRYFLRSSEIKVYSELNMGIAGLSGYSPTQVAEKHFPIFGTAVGMQYPIAPSTTIGGQLGATLTSQGINNGLGLMPTLAMTTSIKF